MYLNETQQRWTTRGCFALSLLMAGLGVSLALVNPQFTSQKERDRLYRSGYYRESVEVQPTKGAFYLGLALTVGAMATAALGASIADPNPKKLAPVQPVTDATTKKDLISELRQGIGGTIAANPWLMQTLPRGKQGSSLILVGSSGSGKSGLASAIALLRALLSGHEVVILDPHSEVNRQFQIWLTGTVYGSKEIKAMLPKLLEPRSPEQKPLTLIIDEFSGWNKTTGLEDEAHCLVDHGIRNARKYGHNLIFASHGREKGLFAGESLPSGQQAALFLHSHMLEIQSSTNQWGETIWIGRAKFKPSKADPEVVALWSGVQIPPSLNPGTLRKQLQGALSFLGMECFYASDDAFRLPPEMEENLKKAIDASSPEFRNVLESMFGLDADLPDDHPDGKEGGELDTSELSDRQVKLIEFSSKHGWVNASTVKRGVRAYRDVSPDAIRNDFLLLIQQSIGKVRGTGEGIEFSVRSD